MIPEIPEIEVHVHLTNGSIYRFEQKVAGPARQNLSRILPTSVFSEPFLMVAGEFHTTHFPSRAVTYLELVTAKRPGWPFGSNISDFFVISEEEFLSHVRHGAEENELRRDQPRPKGKEFVGYLQMELGQEKIFAEVHGVTRPVAVQARAVARLLESPSILIRRGDTGTILVNPANIVSVSTYPGPPDTPPKAIMARYKG